ncbi:hypothetical protein HNI00_21670 [Thermoleptolyngbya oregonensis NK1-22]|uniref:Uncharacterized protein n=1 Tax=Thermoleptolyngbya oregonensis NK1-22 TaxID=2547457 RepID=A0AA97BRG9_9CYAN|nr:hypothetical protein [Thermoleptolyngbya oregonensis]WOB45448.1 hypothetical protein HNI00_21670 [Thermoleptolyngbya oregonensis NK1-22]
MPADKMPAEMLAPCKQIAARCNRTIGSESWHFAAMIERLRVTDPHQPALADREYVYVFFETKIEGFSPNWHYKLKNILKGSAIWKSASNLMDKIPPNCVSSLARLPLGIDG